MSTQPQWPVVALNTVADFLSGGTPSKARPDYWNGDIPWVSAKDMKQQRVRDSEDHISPKGLADGSRIAPKGATLILVRGMTLISDVPICVVERDAAFNQDIKAIVARNGINPAFLNYVLLAAKPLLLSYVEFAGHGTGRMPTDRLQALQIPIPATSEQAAIARVLSTLDDKIELNRRMNETLEAMARATFKSWFVDFDPVRAKAEGRKPPPSFPDSFEDSPLGKIPNGWKVQSLEDIAQFLNGLALQKYPPENDESLPVIKIAQLRKGNTEGADKASGNIPSEYVVSDGDVLFSWSGSLEVEIWCGGPGALNQHLFKVTSRNYPKWFYLYWIREHLSEFQAIASGKATTMGHIQRHHLKEARVLVTDDRLLAAMDRTMAPLVDATTQNTLQSRTLAAVRDALLPKLISGEVRTKDCAALETDA